MKPNWSEQKVSAGMAPWVAKLSEVPLTLFVQPWYGDGIKWKGIIQHPEWTLTLKKPFPNMREAMVAVEEYADKWCRWKEEQSE
jgi:hypothetical protein